MRTFPPDPRTKFARRSLPNPQNIWFPLQLVELNQKAANALKNSAKDNRILRIYFWSIKPPYSIAAIVRNILIEIAACDVRLVEERVRKRGARFRFLHEESGAAALEFALVSIPFLGLLLIIVETGLVFLFGLSIDDTTQKIARLVQTGQLQQSHVMTAGELRSKYLCPPSGAGLLPSLIPCNRIIVDVRTTKSFGSADTSNGFYRSPGGLRFCAGDARSIVVVRMAFAMPVFLPVLALVSNGVFGQDTAGLVDDFPNFPGWNHLISSSFVVQNEPFSGSNSSTSCS